MGHEFHGILLPGTEIPWTYFALGQISLGQISLGQSRDWESKVLQSKALGQLSYGILGVQPGTPMGQYRTGEESELWLTICVTHSFNVFFGNLYQNTEMAQIWLDIFLRFLN